MKSPSLEKLIQLKDVVGENGIFNDGDWVESKDQDPNGDVRLTQLADVGVGEFLDRSSRFLTSEKAAELKCTFLNPGDVLIARMPDPIGRACIFSGDIQPCVTVVDVCIVRPDPESVHNRWLMWMINAPQFRHQLSPYFSGTTRQRISRRNLQNVSISIPLIDEQRRIANILDRADAIRRKRQEAIRLTEELLRSAFLEMFGDPVTNPKGWTSGTILNVVTNPSDMRCGPFGTQLKAEEIVSEGIPLIGIENVKGGKFQSAISKHITSSKAKELAAFDVQAGDVLVTRMGTIGHACVVPQDLGEARISYHLFRIRSNPDKCLPGFLASTITWSGTFLRQLERLSHGAIMAGLKTADLKEVRFLIPPIKLQNQYLEVVADTERLLEKQKQRLMNDDNLFDSLLQRAFRGEL